jgi:hypothetical protein
MILGFLTTLLKILGFFVAVLFTILCMYGVWVIVASVHRYMMKNFKSYKKFVDEL